MSEVAALQSCLAAEQAAVYGYGVVAGVLATRTTATAKERSYAATCYRVHQNRQDALVARIEALGATPVVARAAYRLPFPVSSPAGSRRLARLIERRCGSHYAAAVGETSGAGRGFTADALTDTALRAVAWGAVPTAFPGLPPG